MEKISVLLIGSGGREHAIAWKLAQSPKLGKLYIAPGNAGTAELGENVAISATDIPALLAFAKEKNIDLTLAIPDDPLAAGIVDIFQKEGLKIFGPTKGAAQLEWSKAFSKDFMVENGIPTATYKTFTDPILAKEYLSNAQFPLVVKASGLALGKGVLICQTRDDALKAVAEIMESHVFGNAGNEIVIEEFLQGVEVSTHAFSDGKTHVLFPVSQDHKRIGEGNTGLNTGGMGTVAPVPGLPKILLDKIDTDVVQSTLLGMEKRGAAYTGVLYPGLMLTETGPKVLEYNARFGDPETQVYMRLLETDLIDITLACTNGTLKDLSISWNTGAAANIVIASGGYPESYEKGKVISGIEEAEKIPGVIVFHAGTKRSENGELVTNGGRVLGVSAVGETLEQALETAYRAAATIHFDGMYYRKDIGKTALAMGR
jgi:phosphoribosylamine--glycine ligase